MNLRFRKDCCTSEQMMGLIQITEDNGKTWFKIDKVAGVPHMTYVNAIVCSQHDANVVICCVQQPQTRRF